MFKRFRLFVVFFSNLHRFVSEALSWATMFPKKSALVLAGFTFQNQLSSQSWVVVSCCACLSSHCDVIELCYVECPEPENMRWIWWLYNAWDVLSEMFIHFPFEMLTFCARNLPSQMILQTDFIFLYLEDRNFGHTYFHHYFLNDLTSFKISILFGYF